MKAVLFALTLPLLPQTPAPAVPSSRSMQDEIESTNLKAGKLGNPARSWLDPDHAEVFVYADEKMSWKMQASMMFATAAKKYRELGVKTMIVWNGKKAWTRSTENGAETTEWTSKIPAPGSDPVLATWAPLVDAYNAKTK